MHLDWTTHNLFGGVNEGIRIIDFDDACYHFFACDLAIFPFVLAGRMEKQGFDAHDETVIAHLLAGYRCVCQLQEWEVAAIPLFMEFICLRLYFWIEYHQGIDSFHPTQLARIESMKQWTSQWTVSKFHF